MPFKKKPKPDEKRTRSEWYIKIPNRHGGRVQRSARTKNKSLATNYEVMFRTLGPKELCDWELIDLVLERKVEIAELYRCYVDRNAGDDTKMEELRARFTPPRVTSGPPPVTDLEPLVEEWRQASVDHLSPSTLGNYYAAVRLLLPAGEKFPIAGFTGPVLSAWMAGMKVKPAAKHYRWSGMRHFVEFLRERGVLDHNPCNGIKRPKLPRPRTLHLEPAEVMRLADTMERPFREMTILQNGTGAEITPMLELVRRDVNERHREIFVRGTKNGGRERWVRVAEWAWPTVAGMLTGKRPGERLFDLAVINRFNHWRAHTAAVTALVTAGEMVFAGYTPRDSRHTFAVRLVRAGVPLEVVATQLGHKDSTMVSRVYGRFVPRQEERDRWEKLAAAHDQVLSQPLADV